MKNNSEISELIQIMKDIRDCLVQIVNFEKEKDEIEFIPRKDMKNIFKCTDSTVAKMFNRDDFPAHIYIRYKIQLN